MLQGTGVARLEPSSGPAVIYAGLQALHRAPHLPATTAEGL